MTPIRLGVVGLGLGQWIVETAKKIEGAHVVAAAENMLARLDGMGGYRAYEKENDLRLYEDADQMMDSRIVGRGRTCGDAQTSQGADRIGWQQGHPNADREALGRDCEKWKSVG